MVVASIWGSTAFQKKLKPATTSSSPAWPSTRKMPQKARKAPSEPSRTMARRCPLRSPSHPQTLGATTLVAAMTAKAAPMASGP